MLNRHYEINTGGKLRMKAFFVSDIHETDPTEILANARSESPDVIFVGGDLMEAKKPDFADRTEGSEPAYRFLSGAAKLAPVFYGLGNHEAYLSEAKKDRARKTGAVLLENSMMTVHTDGGDFTVGAVGPVTDADFIREFDKVGTYKILICHEPERAVRELGGISADMILSGHAHGGQWRFFGRGVYAPGQGLFPKYTHGLYGRLLVSSGVANHVRVPRINNPPETVTITFL